MPFVSDEFIKSAEALAKGLPELQNKLAEAEKKASEISTAKEAEKTAGEKVAALVEATVTTLVEQGLIPANEKSAAASNLKSHEETLQALLKTAQLVRAEPIGETVKEASFSGGARSDGLRESDRYLLGRLGFNV